MVSYMQCRIWCMCTSVQVAEFHYIVRSNSPEIFRGTRDSNTNSSSKNELAYLTANRPLIINQTSKNYAEYHFVFLHKYEQIIWSNTVKSAVPINNVSYETWRMNKAEKNNTYDWRLIIIKSQAHCIWTHCT